MSVNKKVENNKQSWVWFKHLRRILLKVREWQSVPVFTKNLVIAR